LTSEPNIKPKEITLQEIGDLNYTVQRPRRYSHSLIHAIILDNL